ncbi:hypothetical protein DPM13_12355 [Paracoccus mutanolyticus]|uniref:DeoR-like transcriptional repressor C-terminal sensor domain-containing protein n=1 Tax=Paracoccus mutanolyticus TaxID=1499308 RepID=A0ABM6WSN8_9RHOB|nr:hypothetical protein DPM13_12355 [Paracoccus mutanolyticus]
MLHGSLCPKPPCCRRGPKLHCLDADPLEVCIGIPQKLIGQADELIVLADSSKFDQRSSLLLCPLARIHTVITDEGIDDRAARMLALICLARAGLRFDSRPADLLLLEDQQTANHSLCQCPVCGGVAQ